MTSNYQYCSEQEQPVYFTPTLLSNEPYPAGFETWVSKIEVDQKKFKITLPDKTTIDAKMFLDLQAVWEAGNYTQYLLHRYNEL